MTTGESSVYLSALSENIDRRGAESCGERDECVEEQIERSKSHWSLLAETDRSNVSALEEAEVDNVQVFKALQMDPSWGNFFHTFDDGKHGATLVVGKKFAEGGQAEIYEAQITFSNQEINKRLLEDGTKWVLKVFKQGTFLRYLQSQLPLKLLHSIHAKEVMRWTNPFPMLEKLFPRYQSSVLCGTLLKDGRFGFLIVKEDTDLRKLIERNMKVRRGEDSGPFSNQEAEYIMYKVALGIDWLHCHNIVHRDLKASNVFIKEIQSGYPKWDIYVADYECSIGVVGTGFFRAPEILQACKERKVSGNPDLFSKAVDIYSYGMTCYEILTGKLPFEDRLANDYAFVLNGGRPTVPKYVENWTCELLNRCWQSNPNDRPTIRNILETLSANSLEIRRNIRKDKL